MSGFLAVIAEGKRHWFIPYGCGPTLSRDLASECPFPTRAAARHEAERRGYRPDQVGTTRVTPLPAVETRTPEACCPNKTARAKRSGQHNGVVADILDAIARASDERQREEVKRVHQANGTQTHGPP